MSTAFWYCRDECETTMEDVCDTITEQKCDSVVEQKCTTITDRKCNTVQVNIFTKLIYSSAKMFAKKI